MSKFKAGDKVKLLSSDYLDYFDVGEIYTVKRVSEGDAFYLDHPEYDGEEWLIFWDIEAELVEETVSKTTDTPEVTPEVAPPSALEDQVGGDHYKSLAIQPMTYSMANGLNACQHTAIKYITRAYLKGDFEEQVDKAIHTLQLWKELEAKKHAG